MDDMIEEDIRPRLIFQASKLSENKNKNCSTKFLQGK